MKTFEKPFCEVVLFRNDVIATSCNDNYCYCWDKEDDWGPGANDCKADIAHCTCKVNYIAGTANCIVL